MKISPPSSPQAPPLFFPLSLFPSLPPRSFSSSSFSFAFAFSSDFSLSHPHIHVPHLLPNYPYPPIPTVHIQPTNQPTDSFSHPFVRVLLPSHYHRLHLHIIIQHASLLRTSPLLPILPPRLLFPFSHLLFTCSHHDARPLVPPFWLPTVISSSVATAIVYMYMYTYKGTRMPVSSRRYLATGIDFIAQPSSLRLELSGGN
ncbi:hypothetical protein BC629DRAFT_754811 [Irpex lacteus]|nr:hypothetical protein BC629DRAFT_754811 [Irpex lacteus]